MTHLHAQLRDTFPDWRIWQVGARWWALRAGSTISVSADNAAALATRVRELQKTVAS